MNVPEDSKKPGALSRFFGRPIVGIVGSLASIVSVPLAAYFFLESREQPNITYFVNPAKAAVVRAGQSARLSVLLDHKEELTRDVTAAQVAFWNAGKKSIRTGAILQPLAIRTSKGERILDATLRKTSREDVVKINVDKSQMESGNVKITWNILEQNDGGVVQIIFEGDETVGIEANAVVESQKKIAQLVPDPELKTKDLFLMLVLFETVLGLTVPAVLFHLRRLKPGMVPLWLIILYACSATTVVILTTYMGFLRGPLGPPFGF